jgi:PAS domain S-box-containing protein
MHTILLVDDEAIIAAELEDRLTARGYKILGIATSGAKAIAMAGDLEPDLVIMDIIMPGQFDGIAAAAVIHSRFDIPVIFLTAYADDELLKRAKTIQPLGYILKPFHDAQITATIEMALHKNELIKELEASRQRYQAVVEDQNDFICRFDTDLRLSFVNKAFHNFCLKWERNPIGRFFYVYLPHHKRDRLIRLLNALTIHEPFCVIEHRVNLDAERDRWIQWSLRALFNQKGELIEYQGVGMDISDHKYTADSLLVAKSELEYRVDQRTKELIKKTEDLEEANTALRILLKQRNEDRAEIQKKVSTNVKSLILPFVEKLKKVTHETRIRNYLDIIETNLNDVVSPFAQNMTASYANLTPAEIRVAQLIKQGKTTKEIAELVSLSSRTIEAYRNSIREKIGIKNKKISLKRFLQPDENI